MENKEFLLSSDIDIKQLSNINGIRFTSREIEIISCLLNMRGTRRIAGLLEVSPKTVEFHVQNIMQKVGCNSRESIIDFVEKSANLPFLKRNYFHLIIRENFTKCLKDIKKLSGENSPCSLVFWEDEDSQTSHLDESHSFVKTLTAHLSLAGIKVSSDKRTQFPGIYELIKEVPQIGYTVYILPSKFICEMNSMKEVRVQTPSNLIFLLNSEGINEKLAQLIDKDMLIDLNNNSYYFCVFEVLKKLIPSQVDNIILEFKKKHAIVEEGISFNITQTSLNVSKLEKAPKNIGIQLKNPKKFLYASLILGILTITGYQIIPVTQKEENKIETTPIRSDLLIPKPTTLLDRPELLRKIDESFKETKGIQTVALVGIGGAGKTTLARQYADQQRANVIWEINAETHEGLIRSFEDLAQSLSKTEEDKKSLRKIKEIEAPVEKEKELFHFAKDRLRIHSPWVLIYDNVEKFTDIQECFPQDTATWGEGKIILTTRNNNIQSNQYVNDTIEIGHLNSTQRIQLFTKIVNQGNKQLLTPIQTQEAIVFLEQIPPFPLDVSIAAYYIKATNTPYSAYLEGLTHYNSDFAQVEENLLKEAGGDYTKTCYGIITLTLQNIINTHEDFRDLLLFIALLDSQNIPKNLLIKYKNTDIVNSFIYNLKKHSFITSETGFSSGLGPTFSIHRSTQLFTLAHLKKLLNLEKNKDSVQEMATILKNYMADAIDKEHFSSMESLACHCEAFFEGFAELNLKESKLEKNVIQSKKIKNQAISYLRQASDSVRNHFPKDSPHVVRIEAKIKKLTANLE